MAVIEGVDPADKPIYPPPPAPPTYTPPPVPPKPPPVGVDPAPLPPRLTSAELERIEQLRKLTASAMTKLRTVRPPTVPGVPPPPGDASALDEIERARKEEMEIRRRGTLRNLQIRQQAILKREREVARDRLLRSREFSGESRYEGEDTFRWSAGELERRRLLEEARETGNYEPVFEYVTNNVTSTGGRFYDPSYMQTAIDAYLADVEATRTPFEELWNEAVEIWENGNCAIAAEAGNVAAWKAGNCERAADILESPEFVRLTARLEVLTGLDERGGQWERLVELAAEADAARDAYLERAMLGVFANRDMISAGETAINYFQSEFAKLDWIEGSKRGGVSEGVDAGTRRQTLRDYVNRRFMEQQRYQQRLATSAEAGLSAMGFVFNRNTGLWTLTVPGENGEPDQYYTMTKQDYLDWRESNAPVETYVRGFQETEDGVVSRDAQADLGLYVRGYQAGQRNPILTERIMQRYFETAGVDWSRFESLRDAYYESGGASGGALEREIAQLFDEVLSGYQRAGPKEKGAVVVDEDGMRKMWLASLGIEWDDSPLGAIGRFSQKPIASEIFGALATPMGFVNVILQELGWGWGREYFGGGTPDIQFFPSPEDMQRENTATLFRNPFNMEPLAALHTDPETLERNRMIHEGLTAAVDRFVASFEQSGVRQLMTEPPGEGQMSAWSELLHWVQQASMMGWNPDLLTMLISGVIDPLNYIPGSRFISASSSAIWASRATRGTSILNARELLSTFRRTFPRGADAARYEIRFLREMSTQTGKSLDELRLLAGEDWGPLIEKARAGQGTAKEIAEASPWWRRLFERDKTSANQVLSFVEEWMARNVKVIDPESLRMIRTGMAGISDVVPEEVGVVTSRVASRKPRVLTRIARWKRSWLRKALEGKQAEIRIAEADHATLIKQHQRLNFELTETRDLLKAPLTGDVPDSLLTLRAQLEAGVRRTQRAVAAADRARDTLARMEPFMKESRRLTNVIKKRAKGAAWRRWQAANPGISWEFRMDLMARSEVWQEFYLTMEQFALDQFKKKYGSLPNNDIGRRVMRQYYYFTAKAKLHAQFSEALVSVNKEIKRLEGLKTPVDALQAKLPGLEQRVADARVRLESSTAHLDALMRQERVLEVAYENARVISLGGLRQAVMDGLRYGTGSRAVTQLRGRVVEANEELSDLKRVRTRVHNDADAKIKVINEEARKRRALVESSGEDVRLSDRARERQVREQQMRKNDADARVDAAQAKVDELEHALEQQAQLARLAPLKERVRLAEQRRGRAIVAAKRIRERWAVRKPQIKKYLAREDLTDAARADLQKEWNGLGRRLGRARDEVVASRKELREAEAAYEQWFEYSSAGSKSLDDLVAEAMWLDSEYVNAVRAWGNLFREVQEALTIVDSREPLSPKVRHAAYDRAVAGWAEMQQYLDSVDADSGRVTAGRVTRAIQQLDEWEGYWGVKIREPLYDARQRRFVLEAQAQDLTEHLADQEARVAAAAGTSRHEKELRQLAHLVQLHDAIVLEASMFGDARPVARDIVRDHREAIMRRMPLYRVSPRGLSLNIAQVEVLRDLRRRYLDSDVVPDSVPSDPMAAGFVADGSVPLDALRRARLRDVPSRGYFRAKEDVVTAFQEMQKAGNALVELLLREELFDEAADVRGRMARGDTRTAPFGPAPGAGKKRLTHEQIVARDKHMRERASTPRGAAYARLDAAEQKYRRASVLFERQRRVVEPETMLSARIGRLMARAGVTEQPTLELLLFMWRQAQKTVDQWSPEEVGALWRILARDTGMPFSLRQWSVIADYLMTQVRASDRVQAPLTLYEFSWLDKSMANRLAEVRGGRREGMHRAIGSPNPSLVDDPDKGAFLLRDRSELTILTKYYHLQEASWMTMAMYDQTRSAYHSALLTDTWLGDLVKEVGQRGLSGQDAIDYVLRRRDERLLDDGLKDLENFARQPEMRGLHHADVYAAWLRQKRLGPVRSGRGRLTEYQAELLANSFRKDMHYDISDHDSWRRTNMIGGIEPIYGGRGWEKGLDPDWMEGMPVEYLDEADPMWDEFGRDITIAVEFRGRIIVRTRGGSSMHLVGTQLHEVFHLFHLYGAGGSRAPSVARMMAALETVPDGLRRSLWAFVYAATPLDPHGYLNEVAASFYQHHRLDVMRSDYLRDVSWRSFRQWSNPRSFWESLETFLRMSSWDPTWFLAEMRGALDEIGEVTADDVPSSLMSPPVENRVASIDWLRKYGMFAPATVDDVLSGLRVWPAESEADFWLNSWGVVPKWADEVEIAKVINSPQLYYQFFRAFGYDKDPVETAIAETANFNEERLRSLAVGTPGDQGGRRAFTLEEMRWWARQRFGKMVYDEDRKVFIAMPWLMYPDEFREWLTLQAGTVDGLKEMGLDATLITAKELDALQNAIAKAFERQEKRLEKLFGVDSADLPLDWLPQELKLRALDLTNVLLADPYWRALIARSPGMTVLNLIGRIQRTFIAFFTAFPIANWVEKFGVKALALSYLFGPPRWIHTLTPLGFEILPKLDTIGDEVRTAFGLKPDRGFKVAADPRYRRTYRVLSGIEGVMDLPFELSAGAEEAIKIGFLRKMAEDAYHVFRSEGASHDLAVGKARIIAMSFSRDFFASLTHAPAWLRGLNQLVPFFSYNFRLATLTLKIAANYPHVIVAGWRIHEALVEQARQEWVKEHGTEAGFNPDDPRWLRFSFEINGTTYYLDVSSLSDYTRRLDILSGDVSIQTFFRIPHPWQTALIGLFTGDETAWGAPADFANLSPWFEFMKWIQNGGMDGFDPYDRRSLDVVQWFWKFLFFKEFGRDIPGRDEMLVWFALMDVDPDAAADYLEAHPEVGLYLQHVEPNFRIGKPVRVSWFSFATDERIAEYEAAMEGYAALKRDLDAYLGQWYLTPWSKDYRQAKLEARGAISLYIEQNPILLEVWAWTQARDFMGLDDSYLADLEVEDYFSIEAPVRGDFASDVLYREAYLAYLERRQDFLRTHPRVLSALMDGRTAIETAWLQHEAQWTDIMIQVAKLRLDAARIEASDLRIDGSLDLVFDLVSNGYRLLDQESFGAFYDAIGLEWLDQRSPAAESLRAAVSSVLGRVRQLVAFPGRAEYFYELADAQGRSEIEAREEEARYRRALDALWRRIGNDYTRFYDELNKDPWLKAHYFGLHPGDDSAYAIALGAIVKQAKDGREFYRLLERNPALLAEFFRRNPDRLAAYERGKEYFSWMQKWVRAIESGVFGLADKVWLSMPAWVRDEYLSKHPESGMHRRNVVQSVAYGAAMEKWVNMLRAKQYDQAADFFASLPDWMRERYFNKHPEQRARFDLDEAALRASAEYFLAHPDDKVRILAANPDLAAWIARYGGSEAAWRGLLLASYAAIPSSEAWLKRTFRERYPEIFSDEARGQRRIDRVNRELAEHPEMRPFYEQALAHQKALFDSQARLSKALPKPMSMERRKRLKKRTRRRMAAMHSKWRAEANRRRT